MKIKNTQVERRHPWPEGMLVQGGARGTVLGRRREDNYITAFVEAAPPGTFLRGEGTTIEEAEDVCWAKYRHLMDSCPDGHGPYEARHYENGSGFCVGCGTWFSNVLEPSRRVTIERLACERVQAVWGRNVVLTEKWSGLCDDEAAVITAAIDGLPAPERTTEDPTREELETAARPVSMEALAQVLADLAQRTAEEENST